MRRPLKEVGEPVMYLKKAVMCMCESERTSLSTSAKIKPALCRATNNLARKTHYVSRYFRRSHLKANKVSNIDKES